MNIRDKYKNSKISITASDILKDFGIKYKDAKTKAISQKLIHHYKTVINESKLTPEESDALFERMMEKKRRTDEEICKKRKENCKKILEENTHVPCINKRKGKKGKETPGEDIKSLTMRIDEIIEGRREKREEAKKRLFDQEKQEMQKECTFTPNINKKRKSDSRTPRRRSVSDLYKWNNDKKSKVMKSRIQSQRNLLRGVTFTPKLCRGTQKMQSSQRKTELVKRLYPSKQVSKSRLVNKKSEGTRFKQQKKREKKLAYKTPRKSRRSGINLNSTVQSLSPCLKSPKMAISTVVTERSIVVLNEMGQFEEINSYIKKQRKIKKSKKVERKIEMKAMKAIEDYGTGMYTDRTYTGSKDSMKVDASEHNHQILSKQFTKLGSRGNRMLTFTGFNTSRSGISDNRVEKSSRKSKSPLGDRNYDKRLNSTHGHSNVPLKLNHSNTKGTHRNKLSRKKENKNPMKRGSRTPEMGQSTPNYLVINGEKIYFDKSSIKGIVDQRKKRARKSAEMVAKTFKNSFRNLR